MPTEQTYKISSADYSDMTNQVADVTVASETTDGITGEEVRWQNTDWSKFYGWYLNVAEVRMALDCRTTWVCGKQWRAPHSWDRVILNRIVGRGKESFSQVLQNLCTAKHIGGDAYAEIIRDDDGEIINLKPLDPGSMVIISDKSGMILRYEQIKGKQTIKFKPEDIFHLTNKRVADSVHGESDLRAIENIILALNESFVINKDVVKKFSRPMMKFMLDTDDTTLINNFITKCDFAVSKGENLYLPKNSVEHELVAVPPNATLNIIPWREHLRNYFWQTVAIPQILVGSANDFTESSAKVAFLSFSQQLAAEQLEIENAVWNQLQIRLELDIPVTIQNEMLSDNQKDGEQQGMNFQPSDTSVNGEIT